MCPEPGGSYRDPNIPALGAGGEERRRRIATFAAGIALSVILGIAVVNLPPMLVIGAIGGLLGAYVVVRYPFAGLLLYTIIFMWRPGETYPVLAPLRIELLIGALTFAAMIVQRFRDQDALTIDRTRMTKLLMLVLLAVAVSVPLAYTRSAALDGLEAFLKLVVWYLMIVHLVTNPLRFRLFSFVFLAAICKIGFDSLVSYFVLGGSHRMGIDRLVGQSSAGGGPNTLAATLGATIPILLLLAFQQRLRRYRLLPAAATIMLTVALFLTGSRSGLLAFLAMLICLWIRTRHRLIVGVLGVALLAAGFVILPDQYKTRYSTVMDEYGSSQSRIDTWRTGLRMIVDHPLTGVGINCFIHASHNEYGGAWLDSHSLYVQIPSEVGLVGTILFFMYLLELFRACARSRRAMLERRDEFWFEETVLRAIPPALVGLLVAGIFGHSFMRYTWYVYGALIVATIRMQGDRGPG